MKKALALMLVVLTCISMLAGCGAKETEKAPEKAPEKTETTTPAPEAPAKPEEPAFTPEANGEWVITANPGSGFDNFTRAVVQALIDGGITDTNLPVVSKPEGDGIVGMQYVANLNNAKQYNNTLLTVGGEDVTQAAEIAGFDPESLIPIAVMAKEVPLLLRGADSEYASFADAVEAMKNGTQVVFVGPRNSYEDMAMRLRDVLGLTDQVFTYIPYDSGKDGLTALMGGHGDFALATPSHAAELIASGDVDPQWVYNDEHYSFGDLVDLPTFEEYTNNEYDVLGSWPVYRIVVASAKMDPEAHAYWTDCMKKASETDSWQEFCAKYSLISSFITGDEVLSIW